ncbi:alpha-amylase domain-containing protein [Granulicella aggregans]|jgi:alpha-amylase|uniref:alpha-amylase domain-containing protein n=1 Tax=Granulicella aggregans TaxID=474949 RepID=UPI0021E0F1E8|nr:alpha-amylase domain-containing protein [Granulicella aggregans]
MTNPWNGKAVLQVFWWNCSNTAYSSFYNYLAGLAPTLANMGFDGIWTPPPCKGNGIAQNMAYEPYDYYDLGQKNQQGGVATWFGSQDEFLRMVAVCHANGLEVYPDIVLDHCSPADADPDSPFKDPEHNYSSFHGVGFAGPGTGRWPRNWLDFHYNPQHWHNPSDWTPPPNPENDFGFDFCYQGRCSDTGDAPSNCPVRANARAWFVWFVRQSGVDGFRFDDVKGFPPEVVEDVLYNAMGPGLEYFCVGEYLPDYSSADLDNWCNATLNRSGTFDYSFRYALSDLASSQGFYNVGNLPSLQQQNRFKTVPFLNNHDTQDGTLGPYINPDDRRAQLAYAVAMTVDGSPQLFILDLFNTLFNLPADRHTTRPWLVNLLWCHQKLAFKSGEYFVRYQGSEQLLILERGARAIVAINNDGANWQSQWISTAFFPNTQLHDYSGSMKDDIWTNQDGWAHIAVPPCSYSVWGPAGITGGFAPTPRRTLQQFEMADDLGDSNPNSPRYGGFAIPAVHRTAGAVWPATGSKVNLFVYADAPQQVELLILPPKGAAAIPGFTGTAGPDHPLVASFEVGLEGRHILTAKLTNAAALPARLYVKVDYLGPKNPTAL